MLEFDSSKWGELGTFFGESSSIPQMIKDWLNSVGKENEIESWREIYECVWHQNSVESAAFAVVPYVVNNLENVSKEKLIEYVIDIGFIELDSDNRSCPDYLLEDYKIAIDKTKKYAIDCLELVSDKVTFRYILGSISSLYNQKPLGDILIHLDCVSEECPKCGECVYPSEIQESGYI